MLRGDRLFLRPVEHKDQTNLVAWRNQPHVADGLFSYRPLSLADQERWFASYQGRQDEMLLIIELNDGTPIGTVGFTNLDFKNQSAEYGRLMIGDPTYLGQGYAREATLVAMDYAFLELNMHRQYSRILATNQASITTMRHCHMEVEGCAHEAHFAHGMFVDILTLSVLREPYLAARKLDPTHWDKE